MSYSIHWTTHVSPSLKSRTLSNKRSLSAMRCHADQYSRRISVPARCVAAFPHDGNPKVARRYTMEAAELLHGLSKHQSHKPTSTRSPASLGIEPAMACAAYRVRPVGIPVRSNAPDAQG